MVERSLSMREVPGSMPGFSIGERRLFYLLFAVCVLDSILRPCKAIIRDLVMGN